MFFCDSQWNFWKFPTLKQILWKTKIFFTKLEDQFLAESTKIEKATFSYNPALSEANIKAGRMGRTKGTYHKERRFASNYFNFLKICFRLRTSFKELIWCTYYPNVHIHIFRKCWRFIWGCFFATIALRKKCPSKEFRIFLYSDWIRQSEYRKIRTRKNSVFGHFSRSVILNTCEVAISVVEVFSIIPHKCFRRKIFYA